MSAVTACAACTQVGHAHAGNWTQGRRGNGHMHAHKCKRTTHLHAHTHAFTPCCTHAGGTRAHGRASCRTPPRPPIPAARTTRATPTSPAWPHPGTVSWPWAQRCARMHLAGFVGQPWLPCRTGVPVRCMLEYIHTLKHSANEKQADMNRGDTFCSMLKGDTFWTHFAPC